MKYMKKIIITTLIAMLFGCNNNKICKYDFIDEYSEGMAIVVNNGIYGFIDENGLEIVAPTKYTHAERFSEGMALVRIINKFGFVDKTGTEVIPVKYGYASSFSEGLAFVLDNNGTNQYFIDKQGKIILKLEHEYTSPGFKDGLVNVSTGDKYGCMDKTGKVVIPIKYDNLIEFKDGLALVSINNKCGFIDKNGKEIIPIIYDKVSRFNDGLYGVSIKGKYGVIDRNNEVVIPFIYEFAEVYGDGLSSVVYKGKIGFFYNDKQIIDFKYDNVAFVSQNLIGVYLNNKFGCIDKTGKQITPFIYEGLHMMPFYAGFGLVVVNNKYRVLNLNNGKELIPERYDIINPIFDDRALVVKDNKVGFVDKYGHEVIPLKYDWGHHFREGLAVVSLKGRFGFIDKNGNVTIPLKYDSVGSFFKGTAYVELDGKSTYINKNHLIKRKWEDIK